MSPKPVHRAGSVSKWFGVVMRTGGRADGARCRLSQHGPLGATIRIGSTPRGWADVALRHGGVYLITGGLGGLGLAFAEHITRAFKANLILVGRSELPATERMVLAPSHEQRDPISEKIRRIQECEASGGNVSRCVRRHH